MDAAQVDAYLSRIAARRPATPDAAALRDLQLQHLRAVPFENLSIHLGEDIRLEHQALVDKVVHRRRGGFCYELNGAFATLLTALGFEVRLLAARVFTADGEVGPLFDHLTLQVDTPEPWLVDVGFGAFSHHPVRLDLPADQHDPAGTFRVVAREHGDVDVIMDGRAQYRVEAARARTLRDFEPMCWWHRTSASSHFTRTLTCSLLTDSGRVTLSGHRLIRTDGGQRREQHLTSDAEVLDAYQRHFGITLEQVPEVRGPVT